MFPFVTRAVRSAPLTGAQTGLSILTSLQTVPVASLYLSLLPHSHQIRYKGSQKAAKKIATMLKKQALEKNRKMAELGRESQQAAAEDKKGQGGKKKR